MTTSYRMTIAASMLAASVATIAADDTGSAVTMPENRIEDIVADGKIISLGGGAATPEEVDSLRKEIVSFYYDQFRHYEDPDAPYFMFMSRDAQLSMGIGGRVRMRGWYEWGGVVPSNGLVPYLIPMPENPAQTRKLGTTPAGTALFFRVLGRNRHVGMYQLYIEGNFNGYKSVGFQLKKAYAIIRDFTVGYASSTFSDPAAFAPTVDAQGVTSKLDETRVLVRYMPTFHDRYTIAVSAEYPSAPAVQDAPSVTTTSMWMPDLAAFLQYQWTRSNHVRLAAIMRTMGYRDLINATNHNVVGWGLQLSSVANPWPQLTTYAAVNYGHGLAGITNDLMAGHYDLVGDTDSDPGHLYSPASWGWSLGVQYNVTPRWFFSATASQSRYLPSHTVDGSDYKYGMYADINTFYDLTPRISVGAEFAWGLRCDFNGYSRAARRIGAVINLSF